MHISVSGSSFTKLLNLPLNNLSKYIRGKGQAWQMLTGIKGTGNIWDISIWNIAGTLKQALSSHTCAVDQLEATNQKPCFSHPLPGPPPGSFLPAINQPLGAIDQSARKSFPKFHLLSNPFSLPQSEPIGFFNYQIVQS